MVEREESQRLNSGWVGWEGQEGESSVEGGREGRMERGMGWRGVEKEDRRNEKHTTITSRSGTMVDRGIEIQNTAAIDRRI